MNRRRLPNGYEPVPETSSARIPICVDRGGRSSSIVKKGKLYSATEARTPFVCGVGYEVRSVSSVDCVEEKFFADLSIFLKWYDEGNRHLTVGECDAATLKNIPHIILSNSVSVKVKNQTYVKLSKDPPGVIHSETVFAGMFREFMELENFPLDKQDLTVCLRFVDERWSVRLLSDPQYNRVTDGVELSEWLMFEPHVKAGRASGGPATFELKMKVFRKYHYYLSNVIGMMGGFTTLAFFTFLFDPPMWEQKSTYCATLLLTAVAFKFVVDGTLPKVSFTTILDLYLLVAFGVMISVIVFSAFTKGLHRWGGLHNETVQSVDYCICAVLGGFWLTWNIGYFWRFNSFQKEQQDRLGELIPEILTNKPSPGSCRSFICCHRDDSDSDCCSDVDSDSDKELPMEDMSKDLLSCCTSMEIEPAKVITQESKVPAQDSLAGLYNQGAPPGWILDERGLLRPEMTADLQNGKAFR